MPNIPTVSFDPTTPNGSQAISLGDDRIRELKVQLQEVIAQDHKMAASGQSADTGFHNQVTFIEQASAPTTTGTNYIAIYGKEINSKTEIFLKDEAGTEYQLTKNGKLYVTNSDGLLAVVKGGTGLATFAQGDLLYASATDVLSALAKNTSATRYLSNTGASNAPAWAQIDVTNGITGIVPVANLGTGTPSASTVLKGNGSWGSSGALLLTSSTTVTAATGSSNITIDSTKYYHVIVTMGALASSGGTVYITFNNDGGAGYRYRYTGTSDAGTGFSGNSTSASTGVVPCTTVLDIKGGTYVDHQINFYIYPQTTNAAKYIMVRGNVIGFESTAGNGLVSDFGGTYSDGGSTVTSFKIQNTYAWTGKVLLYEMLQS